MNGFFFCLGVAFVFLGIVGLILTAPRPCRKCSFCGTPACQLPARHPVFGPVCRRCGKYFSLPGV